jgi:putative ABC transport system permease protein
MKLRTIVWREIFERKNQLATSFLAIFLGITAIVAIRNVTFYSQKAVARELDALGANILILPKSATLQDYYSADMQEDDFPEEYVERLMLSDIQGLDNMSPRLSSPVEVAGQNFTLTGILPMNEFKAKAAWQGAGIFARPENCGTVVQAPLSPEAAKGSLARKRVIETLQPDEVLIGNDVAVGAGLNEGDTLAMLGQNFTVTAVLPPTGTVDDSRIFGHLHTVQKLTGKGAVVNAIEVVGCCNAINTGLVQKINKLLPEAKVVTITQVVDTQLKTNRMMASLSLIFIAIIALIGGATIANYMYANVFERRREIGTLMAMGAGSAVVLRIFLLKALLLGLFGGLSGYVAGTATAVALGPRLAHVPVLPMPILLLWALGISVALSLLASFFPARRAARLDPCAALQEN